jgi:hypothetical protein
VDEYPKCPLQPLRGLGKCFQRFWETVKANYVSLVQIECQAREISYHKGVVTGASSKVNFSRSVWLLQRVADTDE